MSDGPFLHLHSSYGGGANGLACEPWLLPITDDVAPGCDGDPMIAVRKAGRPFWLAANGLCLALGLFLTFQYASGMMGAAPDGGSFASAAPVIPAQTTAYANAAP